MNAAAEEMPSLDNSLQAPLAAHGYPRVLSRLVQIAGEQHPQRPGIDPPALDPRYLMTLPPEEREPFLKASVDRALPAYEDDLALPEAERRLTADLETGDFHGYTDEQHG